MKSWISGCITFIHTKTLFIFYCMQPLNADCLLHASAFVIILFDSTSALYLYTNAKNNILWETIFILVLFRSCDGGAFRDVEPSADLYYSLDFTPKSSNSPSSSIITPRTLALAISPTNFSCCVRLFKWKRRPSSSSQLNSTTS